jgi:hypothetical protein
LSAFLGLLELICFVAYALTILLAVPAYLILHRRVRASLWAAMLVGGLIAALPFFVFGLIQRLGGWMIDARPTLEAYFDDASFFGGFFLLGAIGGAVFYLIAAWQPNRATSL